MKYLFLLAALFGVSSLNPCMAENKPTGPDDDPHDIKLEATTEDERAKTAFIPFQAWENNDVVSVLALTTVDYCTVGVCNTAGAVVAETAASPMAGDRIALSLKGMPQGTYTLYITIGQDMYIYGTFAL